MSPAEYTELLRRKAAMIGMRNGPGAGFIGGGGSQRLQQPLYASHDAAMAARMPIGGITGSNPHIRGFTDPRYDVGRGDRPMPNFSANQQAAIGNIMGTNNFYGSSSGIGANNPSYNGSNTIQPVPQNPMAADAVTASMVGYDSTKPIQTGVNQPGNQAGAFTAGNGYTANNPVAASGIQNPNLTGFSQANLFRGIGNNQGLTTDLKAQYGNQYSGLVNQYNQGSGYASRDDFMNNYDNDMQQRKQIAAQYGAPDPTQGLTSIADMKKLGLWG